MWDQLVTDEELLKQGRALNAITAEKAEQRYGFKPRNAVGLMEKQRDFILQPQFFSTIVQAIKDRGGEVHTNWRLHRILIDTEKDGGVLEFIEKNAGQSKMHYKKFSHAHLSLGATTYDPNPYDLVSVTGVSMNALVFGCKLTGGPIVCGGVSNHIVATPIADPITLQDENSGKTENVSLIRIAVSGCVAPLNRTAKRWYTYYGPSAVNALHCLRKTLPANVKLKVLSVTGCNRVVGKDGRQVEVHPTIKVKNSKRMIDSVTIQTGAAGGGLTQMGYIPPVEPRKEPYQ